MSTARSWDLAGRLSVVAVDLDDRQQRVLDAELDPFLPASADDAGEADVALTALAPPVLRELHNTAKDGLTTGVDREGRLLARYGSGWMAVPAPGDARPRLGVQSGLALGACWADVVRPAMHQAVRARGAVAVHGAAVHGGVSDGTLVCGWSESGKTEVALALVEAGARFLSDKWTVAGEDGEISAFPVGVGVRGWALDALPRLRTSLPAAPRAQLRIAGATGRVLGPALGRPWAARTAKTAARVARRALELGDRAALSPSQLREVYGDAGDAARRVALETVVLLVNDDRDDVRVQETAPAEAAHRLARSAAYERRVSYDLQERGAYAGLTGRAGARDRAIEEETARLERILLGVRRVVQVTCPYPGDPRRVVDALVASR